MNTTTYFGGGTAPLALNHESVVHDAAADSASLRKPSASRIVTEASGAASSVPPPPPRPQNQHVGAAASSSIGSSSCARAWATRCLNGESGRFPPKSGCDLEIASGAARTGSSSAAASSAAAAAADYGPGA